MTGLVVVIGIGNEFRRDDAAGLVLIERLRGKVGDGVRLVCSDGEPTRLLEAWAGASVALVADATTGGPAKPGALYRFVVCEAVPDIAGLAGAGPDLASSHGMGISTAIGLAHALGRMPGELVVHGIQAGDVSQGTGLSAGVAAAMGQFVAAVLADVIVAGQRHDDGRATPGLG